MLEVIVTANYRTNYLHWLKVRPIPLLMDNKTKITWFLGHKLVS